MNKIVLKRAIASFATINLIGLIGYVGYYNISSETTIKDILSLGNLPLLTDINDSRWDIKLSTYSNNRYEYLKINSIGEKELTREHLRNWCKYNSLQKYGAKTENLYTKVHHWCLAPTIEEKIKNSGKTPLSNEGNTHDQIWDTRIRNKLNIQGYDFFVYYQNREKLKSWCKYMINKEYEGENKQSYKDTIEWCVV